MSEISVTPYKYQPQGQSSYYNVGHQYFTSSFNRTLLCEVEVHNEDRTEYTLILSVRSQTASIRADSRMFSAEGTDSVAPQYIELTRVRIEAKPQQAVPEDPTKEWLYGTLHWVLHPHRSINDFTILDVTNDSVIGVPVNHLGFVVFTSTFDDTTCYFPTDIPVRVTTPPVILLEAPTGSGLFDGYRSGGGRTSQTYHYAAIDRVYITSDPIDNGGGLSAYSAVMFAKEEYTPLQILDLIARTPNSACDKFLANKMFFQAPGKPHEKSPNLDYSKWFSRTAQKDSPYMAIRCFDGTIIAQVDSNGFISGNISILGSLNYKQGMSYLTAFIEESFADASVKYGLLQSVMDIYSRYNHNNRDMLTYLYRIDLELRRMLFVFPAFAVKPPHIINTSQG